MNGSHDDSDYSKAVDELSANKVASSVKIERWQGSVFRSLLAKALMPAFYVLNRPSMSWFGKALYDFALRCNGVAINFRGPRGLTLAEARFIGRLGKSLSGGWILDVGANAGAYACELRRVAPDASIVAFEPHPSTFKRLKERAEALGIEVLNVGVGEKPRMQTLYDFADAGGSTQASLSSRSLGFYSGAVETHQVEVITIDRFMADRNIQKIDFLKIDTEGFDLKVLQGAAAAIRQQRIRVIQFEFIGANVANRVTMRDFFEALPGYSISRLCLNGAEDPLGDYSPKRCEIYVNHNLIARPIA